MQSATMDLILRGGVSKGDVLGVARLAGIMGAKRTPELIPLCHPLALTSVTVDLVCAPDRNAVEVTASCRLKGRTGVEMEALTAVTVAALTVYDMCKAVDRGMRITDVRLVHKAGGKSGLFEAD
jgi:cyclic pyranopterin phosphate synthase